MTYTGKHVARAAFLLMITVIISRILGYGREVALYSLFGQNYITDAYRAAFSIPDLIYMLLVGGALSSALIPVFSSYLVEGKAEDGWEAVSILTNWVLLIMLILVMGAYFYTRPLMILLTPGLPEQYISLAVNLTHIMLVQTFFMALNGLAMGILNSHQHFLSPALGSLVYNLVIILVGVLLFDRLGIAAFSYGVALGAALNLAVQIPALRRVGIRYRLTFSTDHPGFAGMVRLMVPVLAGLGVVQFNLFITQNIASHLGGGVLSSLNLAQRIMNLPVGIFAVSIATALFPTLSSLWARGEMSEFKRYTALGIRATLLLGIPASLGLLAIGQPLVGLLFQQGQFTVEMASSTSRVLTYYLIGLAAYASMQVVTRSFYALQIPLIPVLAALAAIASNLFLSVELGYRWGANGLALAYSLAGWINLFLLLGALRWKLGPIGGWRMTKSFLISLGASLVMLLAVAETIRGISLIVNLAEKGGQLLAVVGSASLGIMIYGAIIYWFKLEESEVLLRMVRQRRSS